MARDWAVLAVICILATSFIYPATAQSSVTAYLATSIVKVDGKWTRPNEWTDTSNTTFDETVRFHVKHDEQFLYFLVDFISDTTSLAGDTGRIHLDTNHDHGTVLSTDDYTFAIHWAEEDSWAASMMRGAGDEWGAATKPVDGFLAGSSFDASNDPYSTSPHRIYEFRIPKTILGPLTTFGLCVSCKSGLSGPWLIWPSGATAIKPNRWGDLEISGLPIPEFPIQVAPWIMLATVSCAIYLARRRRSTLPEHPSHSYGALTRELRQKDALRR